GAGAAPARRSAGRDGFLEPLGARQVRTGGEGQGFTPGRGHGGAPDHRIPENARARGRLADVRQLHLPGPALPRALDAEAGGAFPVPQPGRLHPEGTGEALEAGNCQGHEEGRQARGPGRHLRVDRGAEVLPQAGHDNLGYSCGAGLIDCAAAAAAAFETPAASPPDTMTVGEANLMPFSSKAFLISALALRRMTNCSPGRVFIFTRTCIAKSPKESTPCIFIGSMMCGACSGSAASFSPIFLMSFLAFSMSLS